MEMDDLEKLNGLLKIIDNWESKEKVRRGELFKHLASGLWIRRYAVTGKRSISIGELKLFLCLEVLNIFPGDNVSNISVPDIQKYLARDPKAKKYCFNFAELQKCYSSEENMKAAEQTVTLKNLPFVGQVEAWEDILLYLLEKIQTVFRRKIGEYWSLCKGSTVDDETFQKAQDTYIKALKALALHEIFVREISSRWEMRIKESQDSQTCFEQNCVVMLLLEEHFISLRAEMMLLLVLERKRVEKMAELPNIQSLKSDLKASIGRELELLGKWQLGEFEEYCKQRHVYFKQLIADVNELIISYLDYLDSPPADKKNKKPKQDSEEDSEEDFKEDFKKYLEIVENERLDESQRKKLWNCQRNMIWPLLGKKSAE